MKYNNKSNLKVYSVLYNKKSKIKTKTKTMILFKIYSKYSNLEDMIHFVKRTNF